MRAADLSRARTLASAIDADRAVLARLEAMEAPALFLRGHPSVEIVLSPAYLGRISRDVARALRARIEETEAALRALGVEP